MFGRKRSAQVIAAAVLAATLAACSSGTDAPAAPTALEGVGAGEHTTLGPVKHVNAGVLDTAYVEYGPENGPAVVLLHGWPYDPASYIDVGPRLAEQGYHVVVPYLRGFGPTRFLSPDTPRDGEQAAVAHDVVALMDALHIDKAVLGGYDWGARTADVVAALWPQRVKALVSVSGYLITDIAAQQQPLAPAAEAGWWYQYYFSTARGELGYRRNTHDFDKYIWKTASPQWKFDDATYERSASSFDNPDHVAIVVHNYRWRLGLAPGQPEYEAEQRTLGTGPAITVPTVTIGSDFDGANADGKAYRAKFTGKYEHRVFAGVGHDVPQEAPTAFAQAVIDADHL
ncbi:alpha/beta hydrolase family protein [Nocardia nova SH22a]|uniref:Alpha/beta hydrolase family protein n=1 Tax=Nocardia nova SH22a TaxID=1415166 RepID=W5TEL8_9NOCA|nr:alpha/beta hydrolase [Nocardia nova]AHH17413.1 alpha/beta hydrolase family protein [Nocardia nova SH22a]